MPVDALRPDAALAADIASRVIGRPPRSVARFPTGMRHHVFDIVFDDALSVVVRLGESSARAEMEGAVELSRWLRPLGVPLPTLFAFDLAAAFPWLVLERLQGTDIGAVAANLSPAQLDRIATAVARAQAIVATTGSARRYGYAVRASEAPYATWPEVLGAHLGRSRRRIAASGVFDASLVDAVQRRVGQARDELSRIEATPFLHDTTTKNVIVRPDGEFSGIVDVDDLCFGDPRYPAALTLAVLTAYGGPRDYVHFWLRHTGHADDRLFRLYVAVFLLDLTSEHGHSFNGNQQPSTLEQRAALRQALANNLSE